MLNLVEILKDCPKGTILWCPLFGPVTFVTINDSSLPISVKYQNEVTIIHGDKDRLCPLSYSIQFKEKYKNVHLEIIHGADHEFYDFFDELKKKVGVALNE